MKAVITNQLRFDMLEPYLMERQIEPILIQASARRHDIYCPPRSSFVKSDEFLQRVISEVSGGRQVVVLSTVGTDPEVVTDSMLYQPLKSLGVPFLGHSPDVAAAMLNKVETSRLVGKGLGVPMPAGELVRNANQLLDMFDRTGGPLVVKKIDGWHGREQRILRTTADIYDVRLPSEGRWVEQYIQGEEISINVLRTDHLKMIYPPVFKGQTNLENVHAADRLRVVPKKPAHSYLHRLESIAGYVADSLGANGWFELEFVATEASIHLLEVNARFNGTTRLLGLSTGISPYQHSVEALLGEIVGDHCVKVRQYAVEVPIRNRIHGNCPEDVCIYYRGVPSDECVGRISASGESPEEALGKLAKVYPDGDMEAVYSGAVAYLAQIERRSGGFGVAI